MQSVWIGSNGREHQGKRGPWKEGSQLRTQGWIESSLRSQEISRHWAGQVGMFHISWVFIRKERALAILRLKSRLRKGEGRA